MAVLMRGWQRRSLGRLSNGVRWFCWRRRSALGGIGRGVRFGLRARNGSMLIRSRMLRAWMLVGLPVVIVVRVGVRPSRRRLVGDAHSESKHQLCSAICPNRQETDQHDGHQGEWDTELRTALPPAETRYSEREARRPQHDVPMHVNEIVPRSVVPHLLGRPEAKPTATAAPSNPRRWNHRPKRQASFRLSATASSQAPAAATQKAMGKCTTMGCRLGAVVSPGNSCSITRHLEESVRPAHGLAPSSASAPPARSRALAPRTV